MSRSRPSGKLSAQSTEWTRQPVSFSTSVWYTIFAAVFRILSKIDFSLKKLRNRHFWALQQPDIIRTYPVRPMLTNRLFIPASHQHGQKHAIFILIHGGGSVLGDPSMDDEQARMLANQHGYVVASLDYRLGPRYRFPTAVFDVATLISAVLEDADLPVDPSKLVVGGFSAGAVMTLNLAQMPELKHKIKALVSFQPLTDRTGEARGPWKTTKWGSEDQLKYTMGLFDWAYTPVGADLRDKLLSPLYATREDIPQPIFIVTGGADTLCEEASLLAKKLAGIQDDRDATTSWSENGVQYHCAPDMPHCWTHFWVELNGEWGVKQKQTSAGAWDRVTLWLKEVLHAAR